jgi:hypothetical protein
VEQAPRSPHARGGVRTCALTDQDRPGREMSQSRIIFAKADSPVGQATTGGPKLDQTHRNKSYSRRNGKPERLPARWPVGVDARVDE